RLGEYFEGEDPMRFGMAITMAAALFLAVPAAIPAWAAEAGYSVFKEPAGRPAAPDLTVLTLDEAPSSLAPFKGKLVLLNLWATWCAPCVKEMPALDRLQAQLGGEGLAILPPSSHRRGAGGG